MVVPKDLVIPENCPVCGSPIRWCNHINAVDLCGLYFVFCDFVTLVWSCRWCMVLDFRE